MEIVCLSTTHGSVITLIGDGEHRQIRELTIESSQEIFIEKLRLEEERSERNKTMLNIQILEINVRRNAWLLITILGISSVAVALPHPPSLACGDLIQTSIKLTHDLGPCPDGAYALWRPRR